jgi:hypothetical protein
VDAIPECIDELTVGGHQGADGFGVAHVDLFLKLQNYLDRVHGKFPFFQNSKK